MTLARDDWACQNKECQGKIWTNELLHNNKELQPLRQMSNKYLGGE